MAKFAKTHSCSYLLAATYKGVVSRWLLACMWLSMVVASSAHAQPDRQSYLQNSPLAGAEVQSLTEAEEPDYAERNPLMMYQPSEEDPLSFYTRTQDGEWLIPTQVDAQDSWVRVLVLSPGRPTIADISIDINRQPFRSAREAWIDKLLAEAKATFLVRAGEAAADAAGITEPDEPATEAEKTEEETDEATEPAADESAATDSESSDDEEEDHEDDAAESDDDIPLVSAQSRQTSSLFKRLINYLAADQSTAEREEVRWLLAEWTGGPALMTLSPAFAWRRADIAPLWQALDSDADQQLSSEEIKQAAATLRRADIDRNEILDLSELSKLGKENASQQGAAGYPLVVVLDAQTDWRALRQHLQAAYAMQSEDVGSLPLLERIGRGDRTVELAELMNLLSLEPDLVYRVAFENEDATLQLLAIGNANSTDESDSQSWQLHSSTDEVVTIERRETYMELTAAQGEIDEENASGDMQQTQVSVGAVVDGYPLFRLLDHDNNRQLTLRERRSIDSLLTKLDRNQDGQIDRSERPTGIRLTVTLGPFSHQHLAQAVAAQRPHDDTSAATAPDWFVGMDRNNDGDLSRREFQGSPTQFAQFDRNDDGLISAAEVQANSAKN